MSEYVDLAAYAAQRFGTQEILDAKQNVKAGTQEFLDAKQDVRGNTQEALDAKQNLKIGTQEMLDAKQDLAAGAPDRALDGPGARMAAKFAALAAQLSDPSAEIGRSGTPEEKTLERAYLAESMKRFIEGMRDADRAGLLESRAAAAPGTDKDFRAEVRDAQAWMGAPETGTRAPDPLKLFRRFAGALERGHAEDAMAVNVEGLARQPLNADGKSGTISPIEYLDSAWSADHGEGRDGATVFGQRVSTPGEAVGMGHAFMEACQEEHMEAIWKQLAGRTTGVATEILFRREADQRLKDAMGKMTETARDGKDFGVDIPT